ncbi:tetratricopeptide repeat-containing sulfotransferase family protein [Thiorhodovibrio litoralis]|uniref:tetratricopeptide repeat-containing sulfotransferase family protein n=1 Tax=Thiorhodovibrio litoralis TaxID=2952932 RepID=UPI002B263905|nr:sulfotransferase [Thiorhodovibrio litoralis]WPL11575.1 TPR repeat-containing protein YrrB [Thiorhodovibrio litoralis]
MTSIIEKAFNLHEAGQLIQAKAHYREALKQLPTAQHATIEYLLGTIAFQQNKLNEAETLFQNAIKKKPTVADFFSAYGTLLVHSGRHEEACQAYRNAISIEPDNPKTLLQFADTLSALDRHTEALPHYENLILKAPNTAEAYHGYAQTLIKLQRHTEAISRCHKALSITPNSPTIFNTLGVALKKANRLTEAIASFSDAIRLAPAYAEAYANRGWGLMKQKAWNKAAEDFRSAMFFQPEKPDLRIAHAQCLHNSGQTEEAVAEMDRLIHHSPNCSKAHRGRGIFLVSLGDSKEALKSFQRALDLAPDDVIALAHYYVHDGALHDDKAIKQEIESLHQGLEEQIYDPDHKTIVCFALAKLYDISKSYHKAFEHFSLGHRLRRKSLGHNWDPEHTNIEWLKAHITPKFFTKRKDWGDPSTRPIFVVGMPRSGTSLVEQVLSCHPLVHGAGELTWLGDKATELIKRDKTGTFVLSRYRRCDFKKMAANYLRQIEQKNSSAAHIVDKMPHNFAHLWLSTLLFPDATVIHCERHPMATCWSIFTQPFEKGHAYADDLKTLGEHYQQYEQIMKYWSETLPISIHSVKYENLVTSPEVVIRSLLEACNLPFDSACLLPHKHTRRVRTASMHQVTKPIYADSIRKWERYAAYLKELEDVFSVNSNAADSNLS